MSTFSRVFGGGGGNGDDNNPFNWSSLGKMTHISSKTQSHLGSVYMQLFFTCIIAAIGSFMHMQHGFIQGGVLSILAALACLFGIFYTDSSSFNVPSSTALINVHNPRQLMLLGYGFFQGLSAGPLVEITNYIDSSILPIASVSTALVFASFSGAAVYSQRRSYLFLGGILSSIMAVFFWLSLASFFSSTASSMLFTAEIYLGLAMFCGYVLYDTQMIIERSEAGSGRGNDSIGDAAQLFIDFFAIFIRIMIILSQNREQSSSSSRKKRRND